jgi:arginyl-tRNA synthetase
MDVPQDVFARVEFAPPGYVNFTVRPDAWFARLADIAADPANYGASDAGGNARILIEFVSANPTGPLHVGHCRGAVTGDALGRILRAAGWDAVTEYYINDVGNQMGMLGRSMHARGREVLGLPVAFPENGYHGEYVRDLAAEFVATPEGHAFCETADYESLGAVDDNPATRFASSRLLARIREDLDALDVRFDGWFSERTLHKAGLIQAAVADLIARDAAYRDEAGAVLFRMTGEDDDQDRVIVRANGIPTYFAADIAYHHEKALRTDAAGRRFDRVVNIWGADHHGYIPRMRASLAALGHDPDLLEVLLVQMVTLTRAGVVVPLSKRSGHFVTLREVVDEVGRDAVRFLFLLRKGDAQMEFDLALAKSQTMENPVYYVQYGHARVGSILRKARGLGHEPPPFSPDLGEVLALPEEQALVRLLCQLPAVIESAARRREPHHVAFYLMELVKGFHSYYTRYKHSEKVVSDDARKTAARLFLVSRIKEVLARGLGLLGVSAPEEMYLGGEDEAS